jgi:16S rRNA (cytosine1402-N4)-methyltransferase
LSETIPHIPVLYNEVCETFKNINGGYIIDCTTGYGGHTEIILKNNSNIKMICNDQDNEAIEFSKKRLSCFSDRIIFSKSNFENVLQNFQDFEITGVLADIGVSSLQLDKNERGFGFLSDTLDMRMDKMQSLSAKNIVNEYSQNELERIFKDFGEVKEYKKAASIVIQNRPFESAKELAQIFEKNFKKTKIHPATLPFQAIRIEVNRELDVLSSIFDQLEELRPSNCIVAIISFHSLEDRIVKNYFKKWSTNCICPNSAFKCECGNNNAIGEVLTKKPIEASSFEIKQNPRSRSAKMRIFKFYDFN